MALHIDLYHEIRTQQRARKRDPLKIAMLVVLLLASCLIGYYFLRLQSVSSTRGKALTIESEWKVMGEKQEKAKARETELNEIIKTSDTLVQRIEDRFYWAPVLGQFMQTVPGEVQILKFEGDSTIEQSKGCHIVLHGVAIGDEPRTVAEVLRTTLTNNYSKQFPKASATFKSLEDSSDAVQIDGKKYASASFAINLELPRAAVVEKADGKTAAAKPATSKKRTK